MNTADLHRRIENLIRLGTIAQVDESARQIRVQTGQLLTAWLPWPCEIGRNFRRWRPLRVGTQVMLACICGDPAQAQVIGMLYTDTLAPPSANPDLDLIEFNDGTQIQYDSSNSKLTANCVGDAEIISPSLVTIDCPQTTVTGDMTVQGHLTYQGGMSGSGGDGAAATITGDVQITTGDLSADGISLKGHTHPGDSGGTTGAAQ